MLSDKGEAAFYRRLAGSGPARVTAVDPAYRWSVLGMDIADGFHEESVERSSARN